MSLEDDNIHLMIKELEEKISSDQVTLIELKIKGLEMKISANQAALAASLKQIHTDSKGRVYRARKQGIPATDRLISKIKLTASDCWEWTGSRSKHGFGKFRAKSDMTRVDKYIYDYLFGLLPADYDIEQTCGNRICCQPGHMLIVNRKVLLADRYKKFCRHGHPRNKINIYVNQNTGQRTCRLCNVKAVNASLERRKMRDPEYRERLMERSRIVARARYHRNKNE